MSNFNSYGDTPLQIKHEGENIVVSFKQGIPISGQGTVEWTIPAPARGCQSDGDSAYCGAVVLLKEGTPLSAANNTPVNGTFYTSDPTSDSNLHAGDKIGDALVIGAFYEGDKKSKGEALTTSFTVSNINPNTAYYVAVYAADCQGRYHQEGMRAYSSEYGNSDEPNTAAIQNIQFECSAPIIPTDGTGLVPGFLYKFDIVVDNTFPEGEQMSIINIDIDGVNAGTYEQLIQEINNQLALADNPVQSPVPPHAGQFYWSVTDSKLYQFDGTTHNEIENIIREATDPTIIPIGSYWFKPSTKELKRWNVPNPTGWNDISVVEYTRDPFDLDCNDYWFDGISMFNWKSTNWCEQLTIIDTVSPDSTPTIQCGTFWYDTISEELNEWDVSEQHWESRSAIYWNEQPNTLSDGTFWFDLTANTLHQMTSGTWVEIPIHVATVMPTDVEYWFNPEIEILNRWDSATESWIDESVIVWNGDPTDVERCGIWWNSVTDALLLWDTINDQWTPVAKFIQSEISPCEPETIELDTVWYNPNTDKSVKWDGGQWLDITFISHPTDPTSPSNATGWFDPSTNLIKIYNTPNSGWNIIDPIDSENDPSNIQNGTYWFDTTNNGLYTMNGNSWYAVAFTTMPLTPVKGSNWFNLTSKRLMEWSGNQWIDGTPIAAVELDTECKLVVKSRETGSSVIAFIPGPEGYSHGACVATGYADYTTDGNSAYFCEYQGLSGTKGYPIREITSQEFLWNGIVHNPRVLKPVQGTDGVSGLPSYDQIGVGNDGSPDERRELIDSIRAQLGYPVTEVELTKVQFDTAIQGALESFRKRSARAYKRGYYFVNIQPYQQHYKLTDRSIGYHKIVTVVAAHRMTSAFMSTTQGAGMYGQVVLQHLYNMGTYDLTSFHLVAQYIEQLEHLFATRLTFSWNESDRVLSFYHSFTKQERVLIECSVERTEQELLKDRLAKSWIERYALSESMMMLAQIRGKYASLPGAGGGVSLNASELMTISQTYREELITQTDDFIADDPESWGMGSTIIIG